MAFEIIQLKKFDKRLCAEVIAIQKAHDTTARLLRNREKSSEQGFLILPDTLADLKEQLEEGVRLDLALATTPEKIEIGEHSPKEAGDLSLPKTLHSAKETTGLAATSGQCIGFLLSYLGMVDPPRITWKDKAFQEKYASKVKRGAFIHIEQIAVLPVWQGHGVADALMARIENIPGALLIAEVILEPVHNLRSQLFFQKHGFIELGTSVAKHVPGLGKIKCLLLARENE